MIVLLLNFKKQMFRSAENIVITKVQRYKGTKRKSLHDNYCTKTSLFSEKQINSKNKLLTSNPKNYISRSLKSKQIISIDLKPCRINREVWI